MTTTKLIQGLRSTNPLQRWLGYWHESKPEKFRGVSDSSVSAMLDHADRSRRQRRVSLSTPGSFWEDHFVGQPRTLIHKVVYPNNLNKIMQGEQYPQILELQNNNWSL